MLIAAILYQLLFCLKQWRLKCWRFDWWVELGFVSFYSLSNPIVDFFFFFYFIALALLSYAPAIDSIPHSCNVLYWISHGARSSAIAKELPMPRGQFNWRDAISPIAVLFEWMCRVGILSVTLYSTDGLSCWLLWPIILGMVKCAINNIKQYDAFYCNNVAGAITLIRAV